MVSADPAVIDAEVDNFAEQWIRSDLARWEWYERFKARRQKLSQTVEKNDAQLEEDLEQMRRSFMEIDAIFGTSMLDHESNISPVGWSVVVAIMALYVSIGYGVVHYLVYFVSAVLPASFP